MAWVKRASERRRMNQSGRIYRQDRSFVCGCTVQDISDTGARLKIDKDESGAIADIPPEFILSLTSHEEALSEHLSVIRNCQTVWVRDEEMGVKFLGRRPAR
jgi:hypothetical protein